MRFRSEGGGVAGRAGRQGVRVCLRSGRFCPEADRLLPVECEIEANVPDNSLGEILCLHHAAADLFAISLDPAHFVAVPIEGVLGLARLV